MPIGRLDVASALHAALAALLACSLFGATPTAVADETDPTVDRATSSHTVGIRVVPPFVIDEGDGIYSGLTVSLWNHLSRALGVDTRFEERTIEGMLTGVEDGSLFAAAAAITITSEREARVDFTHPFVVTGLGIAVPHQQQRLGVAVLWALLSPQLLWVVALLFGLLFVWGFLVWIFERRQPDSDFGGPPAHGIGSGFWWAAVTMTTVGYGDKAPRTIGGRVVGFIWMFTAIIVISFFTASIASSLTLNQLGGRVSGPQDLPHVRCGALAGAASIENLAAEGVTAIVFPTVDDGLAALAAGRIDAFVHDAPILRYQQQEGFADTIRVLPVTFMEQYYGIALPLGSEHRNEINRALLEFLAGDEWQRLKRRYLGTGS